MMTALNDQRSVVEICLLSCILYCMIFVYLLHLCSMMCGFLVTFGLCSFHWSGCILAATHVHVGFMVHVLVSVPVTSS